MQDLQKGGRKTFVVQSSIEYYRSSAILERVPSFQFISLGPWCHTAGIIKSTHFKTCSYPFDWSQTGSSHHRDIFLLPPESFYYRHIHSPARHFVYQATSSPNVHGHTNGCLVIDTPCYGYEFFYNPHRMPGLEKAYFLRCICRFREVCQNESVTKIFIIADYTNKVHHDFLADYLAISEYISSVFASNVFGPWCLVIHRTTIVPDSTLLTSRVDTCNSKHIAVSELLPKSMHDQEALNDGEGFLVDIVNRHRRKVLSSIARSIVLGQHMSSSVMPR